MENLNKKNIPEKNLLNGAIYIAGNIFNKMIAFITAAIFTRLMTPSEYGIISIYISWVTIISVIIGFSTDNSIRNAFVDMHHKLDTFISSIHTLAAISFLGICVIYLCISCYTSYTSLLIWLCLIESFFDFVINTMNIRYMFEENAVKRTSLLVLPKLLGFFLALAFVLHFQQNKYYGYAMGTCFSAFIFGIWIIGYYIFRYHTFVNKAFWKYALVISIPIIFHRVSLQILGTSDRSIIAYYCGTAETGIYSIIYNTSMASYMLTSAAEAIWLPKFTYALSAHNYEKVNADIKTYIYVVLFAFSGLLTVSPEIILLLGGEQYLRGLNMIFPLISSSFMFFICSIYINIEFYYKKTKMIAFSTIIAAGINLLLNFIFIPRFGAIAAAYTTLFSYIINLILHSIYAHQIDTRIAPYTTILVPLLIFLFSGIITTITANKWLLRWGIMLLLGVIYIKVYIGKALCLRK